MNRILSIALACALPLPAFCADIASGYSQTTIDQAVTSTEANLAQHTLSLPIAQWVYLQSDGRAYPTSGKASVAIWINVDGAKSSNLSIIDWSKSSSPQQHSFNTIGAVYLAAGNHTVSLRGKSLNSGKFSVGAETNLISLVNPASTVKVSTRGVDSGVLTYNVSGLGATSPLPHTAQVSHNVTGSDGAKVFAISSARIYQFGNPGDPLTTIALDGNTQPNDKANWSDNDMYSGAENQAPFHNHAVFDGLGAVPYTISLDTSALPYANNHSQVKMGGDSTLVTLQGGMQVAGSAPLSSDPYNVGNYVIVGGNPANGYPPTGTDYPIVEADIVVPAGHNGRVLVSAKTRIQGDSADPGGTVFFYMTIDGVRRGSLGVQQLQSPNSVSTRTISASYLAAGSEALSPGVHHVVVYGKAVGTFAHLAMTRDLPLIWFD